LFIIICSVVSWLFGCLWVWQIHSPRMSRHCEEFWWLSPLSYFFPFLSHWNFSKVMCLTWQTIYINGAIYDSFAFMRRNGLTLVSIFFSMLTVVARLERLVALKQKNIKWFPSWKRSITSFQKPDLSLAADVVIKMFAFFFYFLYIPHHWKIQGLHWREMSPTTWGLRVKGMHCNIEKEPLI